MEFLKKSRKKPQPGDIFVFKMPKFDYVFGRVIKTNLGGGVPGGNLIYIYKAFSKDKKNIPLLDKNNLLIPPIIINSQGWLQGYFETVISKPLVKEDILSQHCFKDVAKRETTYVDEDRRELKYPVEPCGIYGGGNHRTIDDEVSKVLGIPLAPKN